MAIEKNGKLEKVVFSKPAKNWRNAIFASEIGEVSFSTAKRESQICIFFIIPVEVAQERKTKLNIRKAHFWLFALIENTSQRLSPRLMASSHKGSLRALAHERGTEVSRPGQAR